MTIDEYRDLASELSRILNLNSPPLAITFSGESPPGVPGVSGTVPEPTADGRTGRAPARGERRRRGRGGIRK